MLSAWDGSYRERWLLSAAVGNAAWVQVIEVGIDWLTAELWGIDDGRIVGDSVELGRVAVMSDEIWAVEGDSQMALDQQALSREQHLWMRGHYSFAELRDLVALLKEHPQGLRPMELNRIVYELELIRTQKGNKPSPTTMYHYRRALLKLGIVKRQGRNLVIAGDDGLVAKLVDCLSDRPGLSLQERHIFAEVVLRNSECRQSFFDLFMANDGLYDRAKFTTKGAPVIWQASRGRKNRQVVFSRVNGETIRQISTAVEIQAILWGLRYWARDELLLIDEFFREDTGNLMFPIQEPGSVQGETIKQAILSEVSPKSEWTALSVRDLIYKWAVGLRVSVAQVFNAIAYIYSKHPDHVALIATSRSLATLTTASDKREDFELRSYLRDEGGRYISHIRLHRHLREEING